MPERAELAPEAQPTTAGHRSAPASAPEVAPDARRDLAAGPRGRAGMHPRHVLTMQRMVGNRAVLDMLGHGGAGDAPDELADTPAEADAGGRGVPALAAEKASAGLPSDDRGMAGGDRGAARPVSLAEGIWKEGDAAGGGLAGLASPVAGGIGAGVGSAAAGGVSGLAGGVGAAVAEETGAGVGARAGAEMGGSAAGLAGLGRLAGTVAGGIGAGVEGARRAKPVEGSGSAADTAAPEQPEAAARGPESAVEKTPAVPGEALGEAAAAGAVAGAAEAGSEGVAEGAAAVTHGGGGEGGARRAGDHAPGRTVPAEAAEAGGEAQEAPSDEPAAGPGGGGGIGIDEPAPAGEPLPDPSLPAAPSAAEVNKLGETPAEPEAETGEAEGEAANADEVEEEDPSGEISGQAGAVDSAGQDAGGDGGVIDAVLSRAKAAFRRIAGTVTGAARGVATTVTGVVRGAIAGARNLARTIVGGILSTARSIRDGVIEGIRGVVGSVMSAARGLVGRLMGAISGAMASVRGALMAAIGRALRGEPLIPGLMAPVTGLLHRLFGDIPGQVTRLVTRITQTANSLVDRLIGAIASLSQRAATAVASLAASLQAGVAAAATAISGLAGRAASLVGELPSLLRGAVDWLVGRLLSAVRAAVRTIQAIVNRVIARMSAAIQAWIMRRAAAVIGLIERARARVIATVERAAALVRSALGRLRAFRDWLVRGAMALLGRVLRRVLGPLQRALMRYVIGLIGPAVQQAIATARTMFPNGLPSPRELIQAQAEAAAQAASTAADEITNGLVNPQGDHFSVGFSITGDVGGGVGASVSATPAQLDVVMDYRNNEIGFFVSPGGSAQLSIGDMGATAAESANFAWGTVASFGDPKKDVLQAYGGMFSNANYGYAIGGAYEAGVGLTSGGTIYRGGSLDYGLSADVPIPFGATHTEPGAPIPTRLPGSPDARDTVSLGEVLFPRGGSSVGASANGTQAVSDAASTVTGYPAAHGGASFVQITVTGETSRVWAHPRAGETREGDNSRLASDRATSVSEALRPLVGGVPVRAVGAGDSAAARAGKPETDGSAEDQRATIVGDTFRAGEPGGPGPDIPGPERRVRDTFHVSQGIPTGFLDFRQRQAWGWDTTLSVAALEGAQARGGVYGGAGVSYSLPLGKTSFSPHTMTLIRAAFGLAKIVGDVMTLSPLGLARDLLGVAPAVESIYHEHFGQAVGDWTIPLPSGVAVA